MSSLCVIGLPDDKLCVVTKGSEKVDLRGIDFAFVTRHWQGWRQLPEPLVARAFEYLTHVVSKTPQDLSAHLRRISAAHRMKCDEVLYGSLLDLFIVLDKRGFSLRQRLLNRFEPSLRPEQQACMRQSLLFGAQAAKSIPHCYSSVFNKGLVGNPQLVVKTGRQADADFDIFDELHDLIDSGFLEEARQILERAVMQKPDNEALNRELLELYRYTKNRDAFFATYERLQGLPLALKDQWQRLSETLQVEERMQE